MQDKPAFDNREFCSGERYDRDPRNVPFKRRMMKYFNRPQGNSVVPTIHIPKCPRDFPIDNNVDKKPIFVLLKALDEGLFGVPKPASGRSYKPWSHRLFPTKTQKLLDGTGSEGTSVILKSDKIKLRYPPLCGEIFETCVQPSRR